MVIKYYDYATNPIVDYHSTVKHTILKDYIKQYIATLTKNVRIDSFKIALVDGFAGSGKYTAAWDSAKTIYGSPITMLEACDEAEDSAQEIRNKLFKLNTKFYFVEENPDAFNTLKKTLHDKGYAGRIENENINLFHGDFLQKVQGIVQDIKQRSKTARSLFLLDQYGYSEVPRSVIKSIFSELPGAEIILTFHVDSLLNFLNEDNLRNFNKSTGFSIDQMLSSGLYNKGNRPNDWRLAAQAILHQELVSDCLPDGVGYHTTFYIRGISGMGDYWLVHLSRNLTARNVMVNIHWTHGNHFVHYGGAGLDMYNLRGFSTSSLADMYGFCSDAKALTMDALHHQLPKMIRDHHSEGVNFRNLMLSQANYTPATEQLVREALGNPELRSDILIVSETGKVRRGLSLPRDTDFIVPNHQKSLFI